MTTTNSTTPLDLAADQALRRARAALEGAAYLMTTANGERAARVIGRQFDAAIDAVDTLLELRAGDRARSAAKLHGRAGAQA